MEIPRTRFFLHKLSYFLVPVIINIWSVNSFAQDQEVADSIEQIYIQQKYSDKDLLKILKELAETEADPQKKLKYSNKLIQTAKVLDSIEYLYAGYLQRGGALRLKGDLSKALESILEASKLADQQNNRKLVGLTDAVIADVYSSMGNHNRSISYYREAIGILKKENDSINFGSVIFNAGDEFYHHQDLDSALVYYEEAGNIFKALDFNLGVAYIMGSLGLVYEKLGANEKAEENLSQAIELLKEEGDLSPVSEYLIGLSNIYEKRGKDSVAMNFALKSLKLAKTLSLKDEIANANLKLSEIEEKTGNIPEAFEYYKNYVVYNDSVRNVTTAQELASQRADFEVLKKQGEVDLINAKRKNQQLVMISSAIAMTLIGFIAFGLYRRNRFIKRSSILLEREKNRSDHLLRNILPEETAKELKENGHVKAQKFESATVLFADFKDFTQVAEKLTPEELITTLDYYFSNFDKIMEKYDIEKIKTLGDSYMASSGIPFPSKDQAHRMILAALDIIEFVEETKKNTLQDGNFDIRIGIHSGPIIAGVVGTKKFAYDIWGDTVNIASRMESNSLPGKINISENTYELVKDRFECKYRGKFEAKNRGILKMYFVKASKT